MLLHKRLITLQTLGIIPGVCFLAKITKIPDLFASGIGLSLSTLFPDQFKPL